MLKILNLALFIVCIFAGFAFSQKLTEPKLVGKWAGGEDFGEFIFHKTEELNYYLTNDPNGKIIALLCTKNKIPLGLAGSNGFAYNFPQYADLIKIPADKVFFARSSKCKEKTEEYWFVPENAAFDYDEIVLAEKVKIKRWIGGYFENPNSREAQKEFAEHLKEFIEELKTNPKAEAFIIRNIKMKNRYLKKALRQIRAEKIDLSRIQIVRKKLYVEFFPEFMTITINQ